MKYKLGIRNLEYKKEVLYMSDILEILKQVTESDCECKKEHKFDAKVTVGDGAINDIAAIVKNLNNKNLNKSTEKVFVLADKNTYAAAGEKVCDLLEKDNINVSKYVFKDDNLEPDEKSVGLAVMNFDSTADVVVGVGSGVINDIGKILSNVANKPYVIVGTAPSMDGYASATSSMTMEGIKISLNSKCPDVIVGDIDVLAKAPKKMMASGLGDMVAKYISICEWRISNLINGEYYCPKVAELVRISLKKCVDSSDKLLCGDKEAVRAVFEGLIVCGGAMKLAGLSRPASGVEHYISHIWDMRGAEFNTPVENHGYQCALGTLTAASIYDKIKKITPNKEKAMEYVSKFDYNKYSDFLRDFLGKSAEGMIALEEKEQKYNKESHGKRVEKIINNWDKILKIINEEVPDYNILAELFDKVGLPKTVKDIGLEEEILKPTFKATKDIRDKYVLSRLCWDLGIIDEII